MNQANEIEIRPALKLRSRDMAYIQKCMNDRDYVLKHMTFRMMRAGTESAWEEEYPILMWNDIPVVFGVVVELFGEPGVVNIPLNFLPALDLTIEDLERAARLNSSSFYEQKLQPLSSVLENGEQPCELYVLHSRRAYGATAIVTSEDIARLAGEKKTDIICIPSSVHEWLCVPLQDDIRAEAVNDSIRQVNRSVVDPEDILSDHAYIYRRESGKYENWISSY